MGKATTALAVAAGLAAVLGCGAPPAIGQEKPAAPADLMLLDFESADEAKAWTHFDLSAAMLKQWEVAAEAARAAGKPVPRKPRPLPAEPRAKVELTTEGVTSGKQALKITFDGGVWPTVATAAVPDVDFSPYATLKADVTVSRPCVIGFCAMQAKSQHGSGYRQASSRWADTPFLQAGRNRVLVSLLRRGRRTMLPKARGKVVSFEIYMYEPRKGESIVVDNIRLSRDKTPAPPTVEFAVLGTDLKASDSFSGRAAADLHKQLKDKWTKSQPRTLEQVEGDFAKRYDKLKAAHPKAVMAILRDGQKGFDPKDPDKAYAGWKDAYVNGHGPGGNLLGRGAKRGKSSSSEQFMRHRGRLMRVDLSSIPAGSTILAAELVQINPGIKPDAAVAKSNLWVAEACNRDWDEYEVNAYQYAKEKFWKAISGYSWTGDDPDFLPLFLAYGPSQGRVNVWDFTKAAKYWTGGKHPNCGFFWYSDSSDHWRNSSPTRETAKLNNRPALMLIYVPKP